jgi:Rrf2 family protein
MGDVKFKVSRQTDVALQALNIVAAANKTLSGKMIADQLGTSVAFLSQSIKPVVSKGWLLSRTGPDGGYAPGAHMQNITLLDVIECLEGPLETSECVLDGRECGREAPCQLHAMWAAARGTFRQSLAAVKAVS